MTKLPSPSDHRSKEQREVLLIGGVAFTVGVICTVTFFLATTASQILIWFGLVVGLYGLFYLCIGFFAAPETRRQALRYFPISF